MGKRVCVIGAGVAGLTSTRHLVEAGQQVTVLEASAYLGGTWRYEPRVGQDDNGRPIYTSMYKHLRTNLPKQTMELPDFPMPPDMPTFPTGFQYYDYLKSYADNFDLNNYIKFLHEVTLVTRDDDRWRVKYRSVVSGAEFEEYYDYVFVCNGHHSKPSLPHFPGEKTFKGTMIHSHDYREPEPYRNRRVLVVGAGPSAMDIGLLIADYCKALIHSHHSKVEFKTPFPDNYIQKPDVEEFTESGVRFKDGTYEDIDDVIYCTGFEYTYPFLDETSGLSVQPHSVTPLYRYMVNIRQPTMVLLGLVVRACVVIAIDAQARYGTALVAGQFSLPSQEDMMKEWQARADNLLAHGRRLGDIHLLAMDEDSYYANLTSDSGIERVAPVLASIKNAVIRTILTNLYTYRNYDYTVLDERHFVQEYRHRLEAPVLDTQENRYMPKPPVLDTQEHSHRPDPPVLYTQEHRLRPKLPALDTQENNRHRPKLPVLDTQKHRKRPEPAVLDLQEHTPRSERPVLDTQEHRLSSEAPILETQENMPRLKPSVLDT